MDRFPPEILERILESFKERLQPWQIYSWPRLTTSVAYDWETLGSLRLVCRRLCEVTTPLFFEILGKQFLSICRQELQTDINRIPAFKDLSHFQRRLDELDDLIRSGRHLYIRRLFVHLSFESFPEYADTTEEERVFEKEDERLADFINVFPAGNIKSIVVGDLSSFPRTVVALSRLSRLRELQIILSAIPRTIPLISDNTIGDLSAMESLYVEVTTDIPGISHISDIGRAVASIPRLRNLGFSFLALDNESELSFGDVQSLKSLTLANPTTQAQAHSSLRCHLNPFLGQNSNLTDLSIIENIVPGLARFDSTDFPRLRRLMVLDCDWHTIEQFSSCGTIASLEIGISRAFASKWRPQRRLQIFGDFARDLEDSLLEWSSSFAGLNQLTVRVEELFLPMAVEVLEKVAYVREIETRWEALPESEPASHE